MGFGRKVGAFLGLVPDDRSQYPGGEDYVAEYPHAGDEYAQGYPQPESTYHQDGYQSGPDGYRPTSRGYAAEPVTQGALAIKPDYSARREPDLGSGRPATVKLTGFGEARIIGEKYRDGQSVILDMTEMTDSDARRLVDFSAGLAFSLRGSIEKVAPKVFMLLPPDTDVSAFTSAELLGAPRAYAGR